MKEVVCSAKRKKVQILDKHECCQVYDTNVSRFMARTSEGMELYTCRS